MFGYVHRYGVTFCSLSVTYLKPKEDHFKPGMNFECKTNAQTHVFMIICKILFHLKLISNISQVLCMEIKGKNMDFILIMIVLVRPN